jgi:hypothetical protein
MGVGSRKSSSSIAICMGLISPISLNFSILMH